MVLLISVCFGFYLIAASSPQATFRVGKAKEPGTEHDRIGSRLTSLFVHPECSGSVSYVPPTRVHTRANGKSYLRRRNH
jgi:hypothetical protein